MKRIIVLFTVLTMLLGTAAIPALAESGDTPADQTDQVTSASIKQGRKGPSGTRGSKADPDAQQPELPDNAQNEADTQQQESRDDTQNDPSVQSQVPGSSFASRNGRQQSGRSKGVRSSQKSQAPAAGQADQNTASPELSGSSQAFDFAAFLKPLVEQHVLSQEQYEQVLSFITALIATGGSA